MVELMGVDALLRELSGYQTTRDDEMEAASRKALDLLRSPLREYPPEREGQTYIRTFDLQGGWESASISYASNQAEWSATASNPIAYGPFVQGDPDQNPHQAGMHVGRWNTTQATVDDNQHELVAEFEAALQKIADRLGQL